MDKIDTDKKDRYKKDRDKIYIDKIDRCNQIDIRYRQNRQIKYYTKYKIVFFLKLGP